MKSFRSRAPKSISNNAVHETRELSGNAPDMPSLDCAQFFLADGSLVTMRPSGTEPKIKFYFSVREKAEAHNLEEVKANLRKKIVSINRGSAEAGCLI
jgi:phosphoglucomutase